jgi:hypothetical protein
MVDINQHPDSSDIKQRVMDAASSPGTPLFGAWMAIGIVPICCHGGTSMGQQRLSISPSADITPVLSYQYCVHLPSIGVARMALYAALIRHNIISGIAVSGRNIAFMQESAMRLKISPCTFCCHARWHVLF